MDYMWRNRKKLIKWGRMKKGEIHKWGIGDF